MASKPKAAFALVYRTPDSGRASYKWAAYDKTGHKRIMEGADRSYRAANVTVRKLLVRPRRKKK
jgi:hypothetical protein